MKWPLVLVVAVLAVLPAAAEEKAEDPNAPWQPKKGDTVYVPMGLLFSITVYDDVPWERLECPSTRRCYYRYKACEPLTVLSANKKLTRIYVTPALQAKRCPESDVSCMVTGSLQTFPEFKRIKQMMRPTEEACLALLLTR